MEENEIFSSNEKKAMQDIPGLAADMAKAIAFFASCAKNGISCMKQFLEIGVGNGKKN